ncbi:MAG: Gfo/Idh/MocA family oxidoreductase [Propionibacteriaceae bacterium]
MINVGVVGLGKMGLSHLSMFNAHPEVNLAGICDSTGYMLSVLGKYTGLKTYSDMNAMLADADLDAVVISTPSSMHASMVRTALDQGLHVFCEKPFCLDPAESDELTALAKSKDLVTQVGYHYRYVGAFQEVKRLLESNAIGDVTHVLAEAYGPVVLKPQGATWRSTKGQGGGSLYDYAAHPLNLVNWYLGEPKRAGGSVLNRVFSRETDDEVFSTLFFDGGQSAQLSVSWSDESQRKMTTKVTIWGTQGRIFADRQEVQVFLREEAKIPENYTPGWNVKYTTELTDEVWFYLRGEEYSAQIDSFVRRIEAGQQEGVNSFESAAETDRTIQLLIDDATGVSRTPGTGLQQQRKTRRRFPWPLRRREVSSRR